MINVVIIDDEHDARFMLINMLEKHYADRMQVVGQGHDITSGIEAIQTKHPDLVFLDIQMRNGTGFDLLNRLNNHDFEVVFITAYDEFAIKAFEFSASGYLLKPIRIKDLQKTITRIEGRLSSKEDGGNRQLKVLVENTASGSGKMAKLVVAHTAGFEVLIVDQIVRMEADSNYTTIYLETGDSFVVSRTLGEYDSLLADHGFMRVHQKTLVNLRHVTGYSRGQAGDVRMSDGAVVPISRRRKADLMKRFL